mgnify:FL=1
MNKSVLHRAMGVLLSAALVISFVPTQGLAESVALAGSSPDAGVSGAEQLGDGTGSLAAAPNASTEAADGGVPDGDPGASALANDVAAASASEASESNGADEPAPAMHATAPLVNIIEADSAGNPHAQMYTTLLDKDGKVVDTNDPTRAVD